MPVPGRAIPPDSFTADRNGLRVTATDSTQYFFGRNKLPGQDKTTDSAWTVPVYGNHANEPGHATKFADSRTTQAWRWNLDYVVDPHGNTTSYWYEREKNQYAAEVTESKNLPYVRGGTLTRIDYGTWDRSADDRSVKALAQVVLETKDRCNSGCTEHDGTHWPDTPVGPAMQGRRHVVRQLHAHLLVDQALVAGAHPRVGHHQGDAGLAGGRLVHLVAQFPVAGRR